MIKNIVFDIGNVLLKFDRDEVVKKVYDGENFSALKHAIFYGWEEQDEGIITPENHLKRAKSLLSEDMQIYAERFLTTWEELMTPTDGMAEYISQLKSRGFGLYIISNMTDHFIKNDYKYPIFKLFDGIVYSAPIKMAKPNPDIYNYLLDKYNLIPNECVFTDDNIDNINAAKKLGFHTYHFTGNLQDLKNYIEDLTK